MHPHHLPPDAAFAKFAIRRQYTTDEKVYRCHPPIVFAATDLLCAGWLA